MKNRLLVLSGVFFYTMSFSQVGINTPTPEATLDVRAKNHNGSVTATDGILVPRVNSLATSGSVNGQLVYLTQTTTTPAYSKGFYYWDGTKWVVLSNNSSSSLTGDVINVAGLGSGLSSPNAFSGATYNPNVPLDPTNIYINNTDGTTWTYNAAQNNYVSYIAPTSTEWNLSGTNTDAGSNKTTAIYRTGKITEGSPSAAHIDLGASGTGATGWTWMDFFDGTSTTTPKANLNWNPTQNVFTVNGMGTVTAINAGTTKGKVGVGTILPTAQMHVVGDARFGIESGAHTYTNADSSGGAWFDFYANESTVKSNLAWDNTNSRFNINGMGTVTTINAGNTKANVGVGYATPQTQLHVGGDARFGLGSGAHTYTNADSSGGAWFDFYANESTVKSNLAWDNTNSRFNINGMGTVTTINAGNTKANVGVGYATPQTQLHVGGDARFGLGSGAHTYTNADSSGGAWFDFYTDESTVKSNLSWDNTNSRFNINGMGTKTVINAGTTANVGVGLVNPQSQLDVSTMAQIGLENASGSLDQRVQLGADSGGSYVNFLNAAGAKKTYLWYNQGSARFEIGNTTAEPFLVNAAVGSGPIGLRTVTTTNSLDINVKGAFGISSSGNYTGHTWDGNCSEDVTEIGNGWINSQRNDNANILLVKTNGSTGINNAFIAMKNGTTVQGSITPTSTTAVAFNTTSDLRLKENIKNTDVGITDLMKISVKDYNYKADNTKTKVTGFIAQDLYKVFPNAVTVGGEDAQANPWQVDYGKLTPLLVKAVQDQQKVIENQNSEISSLKKEIELIKSKLNK